MRLAAPPPRIPFLAALLAAAMLAAGSARADREGYTYLSYVGPEVSLVSPADEDAAARLNMPVLPGDVLVTGNASRVEAILSDGNVVRLDGRSELRFERLNRTYEADDDRTVLALARGAVAVEVREAVSDRDRALRLDTDDASIVAPARSLFRVDAGRHGTEIYVLTGRVEVSGRGGRAVVGAGEYVYVAGDEEIEIEAAGVPRDRFTRFLEERRDRADRNAASRHVASDYSYDSAAADLDEHGAWIYVASAGTHCWRPNVPPGWTPYSLGSWRWTPAGLTWVSYEPWGWLPYHYGTWAYDDELGWYWIPATTYAPAWVYWSYGTDWTGWCPVGWYGGYYESYYRSTRATYGNERGGGWLPNLRGQVEVAPIDRRGWNFVATSRVGSRLGPRDVIRGDRVSFPRGQTAVVSTAPLRVERGAGPAVSVPEAIRRAALPQEPSRGLNTGLASILRRERDLDAPGRDELRRSTRPTRELATRTAAPGTARSGERARTDQGWRASPTVPPAPVRRREADRREPQGDSGWRAPATRVLERSTERHAPLLREEAPARRDGSPTVREAPVREAPVREAPSRQEPARSAPAPVHAAPVRSAPVYSAPAPAPAPAAAPAPAPAPAPANRVG